VRSDAEISAKVGTSDALAEENVSGMAFRKPLKTL
jgi:hypothetical protein